MIYISFGMRKAGSTLAFEVTKEILEQNGMPQHRLSFDAVDEKHKVNFVEHFTPEALAAVQREVLPLGYPMVIKTHQRPSKAVAELLERGGAIGQAVYRDPRDMALSLVDAGTQAREKSRQAFSEFHDIDDTLKPIRRQIDWLGEWLSLPNIMPVYYEDMAFDSTNTINRVAAQIGLKADPERIRQTVTSSRFTQFNKGVSQRYKTEMSEENQAYITDIFGDFIARYCGEGRPKQPEVSLAVQPT